MKITKSKIRTALEATAADQAFVNTGDRLGNHEYYVKNSAEIPKFYRELGWDKPEVLNNDGDYETIELSDSEMIADALAENGLSSVRDWFDACRDNGMTKTAIVKQLIKMDGFLN